MCFFPACCGGAAPARSMNASPRIVAKARHVTARHACVRAGGGGGGNSTVASVRAANAHSTVSSQRSVLFLGEYREHRQCSSRRSVLRACASGDRAKDHSVGITWYSFENARVFCRSFSDFGKRSQRAEECLVIAHVPCSSRRAFGG